MPPEPQPREEPESEPASDPPRLQPGGPLARRVTEIIRSGTFTELEELLRAQLTLAGGPGHAPEASAKIRALIAAGIDVDVRFIGPHTETGCTGRPRATRSVVSETRIDDDAL